MSKFFFQISDQVLQVSDQVLQDSNQVRQDSNQVAQESDQTHWTYSKNLRKYTISKWNKFELFLQQE